ncbi:sulfiredoxin, chloroplastic/mitochondrial-like isoform X1 [Chenopodium quinoa]|uniref:sulfiredoxin, chloroplastic/mitochondrial-like isoform X1 n=1 Tax=Chenopodium quinoa TaxID=63459 RepID=UPI000B791A69|nr:sulfiredoxin, chloroplastic/mitochondrial-like isoform X1 [Chenopodium quinoa]XP_021754049.1 sulfiredoxin, chloroplastic/mitochondrial-like isoform X1 [Chenopodium quinoa]XP_021754050.1 sulfiredoxin, chloroplastic/mitochondrial-like isoform X1 [Chenopodium quinoa]XP_021754051.1 sulfiredoxin, chloroplastic/mitochondrial-like isoform X1 [Chenopodium quinoa]
MASLYLPGPATLRKFSLSASSNNGAPSTTQQVGPVVLELPLDKIRRPLMRTRANDPQKVHELMDSIKEIGLQVPIDVLEVDGVYYGFSGCHRYEAHQRLGLPAIRCKVRRGTKETLRFILQASSPVNTLELYSFSIPSIILCLEGSRMIIFD